LMISEKTERRGIIEVTPLTIGAISVGVVVCILLIISVITLIVSRVRRKSRRRVQATRCQQAIRQFDAMNKNFGKDNSGYTSDGNSSQEEVARALQEEGSISSFPDSIVITTPTAPPPDVVPDYTEESESQDPVDAVNDTNQLIVEDNNPDAVRILSIDTISAAPLVVNLPPDSN